MVMEMTVVEETPKKLVFDLAGAGHTLCNALKKELWKSKHIKVATYTIKHPLKGVPTLIVETDGEVKPVRAVKDSISHLLSHTEKFSQEAKKI